MGIHVPDKNIEIEELFTHFVFGNIRAKICCEIDY